MKSLLIVDDHLVVRHGLRRFVEDLGDLAVGGEAESGQQALAMLKKGRWDMVLLDLSLQDMSGLDLLKQIRRLYPALPVLVVSAHAEATHAMQALRAGAAGYITKDSPAEELQLAIHRVARGETYLGPKAAKSLAANVSPIAGDSRLRHEMLSKREFEVMLYLSRGEPLAGIAGQLSLNPKTVSTYRARILEKLGLHSNADLVRYVMQHDLDVGGSD